MLSLLQDDDGDEEKTMFELDPVAVDEIKADDVDEDEDVPKVALSTVSASAMLTSDAFLLPGPSVDGQYAHPPQLQFCREGRTSLAAINQESDRNIQGSNKCLQH